MRNMKEHIRSAYSDGMKKWVVLFPEGGFLCNMRPSSQRYWGVITSSMRGLINDLPRTNSSQVPLLAIALKSHNFTRKAM